VVSKSDKSMPGRSRSKRTRLRGWRQMPVLGWGSTSVARLEPRSLERQTTRQHWQHVLMARDLSTEPLETVARFAALSFARKTWRICRMLTPNESVVEWLDVLISGCQLANSTKDTRYISHWVMSHQSNDQFSCFRDVLWSQTELTHH